MGFFDMFKKKKKDDFDFSSFKSSTDESHLTNAELTNNLNNLNPNQQDFFENQSNNFTFSQQQNQLNNQINEFNNVQSNTDIMQEKQFHQSVAYNNFNPPNYDNLKRDLELIIEKINTLKAMIDATDIRLRKIEEMLESHKEQRKYY
ncbi:MAG: hypothetical protein QXR30_01655 [Candidatus Woesearchaeota archaeon]